MCGRRVAQESADAVDARRVACRTGPGSTALGPLGEDERSFRRTKGSKEIPTLVALFASGPAGARREPTNVAVTRQRYHQVT